MIRIGIDLGTTNSCVAFHDGKNVEVIDMADGRKTMPSVVSFMEDGEVLVGQAALDQVKKNTEFTLQHIKRHIGQKWRDDVDTDSHTAEGPDGMIWFKGRDRLYSPQELSALIMAEMKAAAEERIGKPIDGVVIGVPAGFLQAQREATIEAGRLAGFKKVDIEEEPTAAAIAYGIGQKKFRTIAVFDLGGGTFDIAVMEVGKGNFRVLSKNGHMRLGGMNFDNEIMHWVIDRHKAETGVDLKAKPFAVTLLQEASEAGKKDLTKRQKTEVVARFLYSDPTTGAPQHVTYPLSKDEFEDMVEHWVGEALGICKVCLDAADRTIDQIEDVILIGGMTRMPMVHDAVKHFFKRAPLKSINPDEAVARGCAARAAERDGRLNINYSDVVSMSFGIETASGAFMPVIAKGAAYGAEESIVITSARDGQPELAVGVFQGEGLSAAENSLVMDYRHPVPNGPAGTPALQLTFMVGDNGLLRVIGTDLSEPDVPIEIGEVA
jgi:molecular chaperone DnaK